MNSRLIAIDRLQDCLGYRFKTPALLEQALTHASAGDGARKITHNERLEFLGDRVLNLLVAERLMEVYPAAVEGDLAKRHAVLVSRPTCAEIGRAIGVGPALRLPGGETRRGAREQDTLLADAVEALLAAVYLEAGLDVVRPLVTSLWAKAFQKIETVGYKNPKSELQEWAAARKLAAPRYDVTGRVGPDHAPVFTVSVSVEGLAPGTGTGPSRQEAEKAAATALLKREGLQ
jgi:ribonuclease-3